MGAVAQSMTRRLQSVAPHPSNTDTPPAATFVLQPATQQPDSHSAEGICITEEMQAVATRPPHDQMDAAQALVAVQELSAIIVQIAASDTASGDITAVCTASEFPA